MSIVGHTKKRILTRRDIFEDYGFPIKTQQGWSYRGVGPTSYRVNGKVVVKRDEFEAWLFRNKIAGEV